MDYKQAFEGGMQRPSVSVVIPTLNEAKNLPLVLPFIPMDVVDEVILVDGRSTDATVRVARQLMPSIRVVLEPRPGKGAAMRRGYAESSGAIIVLLDADGSNDPREIPRYIRALMEGADLAKGSRFAPMGGTTDMPRLRMFGNWGFVVLANLLFGHKFTDLLYGFHAFWRHCLDYLDLEHVDGFEIDASIYLQAVRKRLKVVDVPSFEGFRFYGKGKLETFPDGWRVLRTILREWRIGLRSPSPDPQVGFRSYGVNPTWESTIAIPVTGAAPAVLPADQVKSGSNGHGSNGHGTNGSAAHTVPSEEALLWTGDAMPHALLTAMDQLGASSGSLVLFDSDDRMTHAYRAFGRTVHEIHPSDMAAALQNGLIAWVARERRPALIANTRQDPRWVRRPWEEQEQADRSAMVVPFDTCDQCLGVITLTRPQDRPFGEEDLRRLTRLVEST